MPDLTQKYGSAASLTTTGLSTLANGASATSDTLDLTSANPFDVHVEAVLTTGASATAGSLIRIYAKFSIDNTDFTTDVNDRWLGNVILSGAGAATHKGVFSVAAGFPGGIIPPYVKIRVQQDTSDAFTAGTLATRFVTAQTV